MSSEKLVQNIVNEVEIASTVVVSEAKITERHQ